MNVFILLLLLGAVIVTGLEAFGLRPVRPSLGWLGVCLLAIVATLAYVTGVVSL